MTKSLGVTYTDPSLQNKAKRKYRAVLGRKHLAVREEIKKINKLHGE